MDDDIPLYQRRLKLEQASFSRIDHEDTMVAIVYRVTRLNGTDLILKISARPQDYFREVFFLSYFANKLPVPRVVQVVPPENDLKGAVLMECLPGSLLKVEDITDALAFEIGSLLAQIHLNKTPGFGDLTQPKELTSDPRAYFTMKFEEGFSECSNHLPASLLKKCRHYYDAHVDLLAMADGPCMIHRDFRPGNLIVNEGKLQGIIDWASARASFAQEDFCPLEHTEWPLDQMRKQSFLAGYESIRPVPNYRAMMPLLRLGRAFATIGFTVKSNTWESINARPYLFNRRYLETFF